jgi:hypothetical protein
MRTACADATPAPASAIAAKSAPTSATRPTRIMSAAGRSRPRPNPQRPE